MPQPDRARQVFERDHHSYETISLCWIVSCPQLQDKLLLFAKVDRLLMSPPSQIPKMETTAVLAAKEQLGVQPVFNHVWGSPLARYHRIVAEMPPEIVCKILWSAFHFPLAEHIEGIVIEQEDAARPFAIWGSEGADVDALRPAMDRVKSRIVYSGKDLL